MSYTKSAIEQLIKNADSILQETINDNDLTNTLECLNGIIKIGELISIKSPETNYYWNEISSEAISVVYASISGHNRLALSGLRNILELSCHAFYYYDHIVELKLSINEDSKADKYVSSLINNHHFFTTKYIKTFNDEIITLEKEQDSISKFLAKEYAQLCDIVHGRNSTLFKKEELVIKYSKKEFQKFNVKYINLAGIISTMYILRFQDKTHNDLNKLAMKTNTLKEIHE